MTTFTYGGIDPAERLAEIGCRFRIVSIEGRGVLAKEVQRRSVPGSDGDLYLNRSIPARPITVHYKIQADNQAKLLEAEELLNGIFSNHAILPLIFSDQAGTFYGIQEDASESDRAETLLAASVTFFCADPFRYGDNVAGAAASVSSAAPHLLDVATNYTALPVLTVTTKAAADKVTVAVNGRELHYETGASIPAGTVLKVDGIRKELKIGDALKVLEVSGWFPYFVKGSNSLSSSPATGISWEYQERNL